VIVKRWSPLHGFSSPNHILWWYLLPTLFYRALDCLESTLNCFITIAIRKCCNNCFEVYVPNSVINAIMILTARLHTGALTVVMRNNGIILEWLQVRNQLFLLQSFLLVLFGWQTWHNVKKQLLTTCTVSYITSPARPPPFRTNPWFTWPAMSLCTVGNSISQLLGVIKLQNQLCWWSPHLTQPHIKLSMEGSTTIRPIFLCALSIKQHCIGCLPS